MGVTVLVVEQEFIYNSCVRTQDVVCLEEQLGAMDDRDEWRERERERERESEKSMLAA